MTTVKLVSAALIAAATLATPALAREHHVRHHHAAAVDVYANAAPGGHYAGGFTCVPAPRVGAFATAPWTDEAPCQPYYGTN